MPFDIHHLGPGDVPLLEGINVQAKHVAVYGNNVRGCDSGIMLEPTARVSPDADSAQQFSVISANSVRDCTYANILIRHDPVNNTRASGYVSITGNVTSGGPLGISVGQGGATTAGPINVTVAGNICFDQTDRGIRVVDSRRVSLSGNVASGANSGLSLQGASKLVSISGGCYSATGADGDGVSVADSSAFVTISGVTVDNVGRSGIRVSGTANNVTVTSLIALDDQGSPTMDNAVFVSSSGANISLDGHSITSGATGTNLSGLTSVNGFATESANANTPTLANFSIGDLVKFTDTGDGSGNGIYLRGTSGWEQLSDQALTRLITSDVGINWWPSYYLSENYYVCNSPNGSTTGNTLGNGSLRVSPWVIAQAVSITRLWVEHTAAGESGSVYRIGIYSDDGTGKPGALLLDAGTVAVDGSAAVQEVTVSLSLPPGLYWVGGAVQNAATTQPTMRLVSATGGGFNTTISFGSTLPSTNSARVSYLQTGITGELPDPMNPSAGGGTPVRIGFKVA
jgi:parallel beta-helix repeat protein